MEKSNKGEFIIKANKIHNNKYNYDLVNYANSRSKIIIICPTHGKFKQTPHSHLCGNGCILCAGNKKYTTQEFINKVSIIHNNKYNYDLVNYINNVSKIDIICSVHGIFQQTAQSHLKGCGCFKCMSYSNEEFIKRAIKIHGDRFIYDNVNYINSNTKIEIICKKHGPFSQLPSMHLYGQGCPCCHISSGELQIMKILDDNNISYKCQYAFDDLKFKNKLYFDFGVLDNGKLSFLIEYNGIQHYQFNEFMHGDLITFEKHKKRDSLKMQYCIENNIKCFIIRHDENIMYRLQEICI